MKSIKFTVIFFSDDLKNASRDNPKHFWKILGGHKRKQQPNIEIKGETHYRDIARFRNSLARHCFLFLGRHYRDIFFLFKNGFLELITATFINYLQDIYMYNEYMFND